MFINEEIELLLPTTFHFVVLTVLLALWAWRQPRASRPGRWRHVFLALAAWAWLLSTPVLANQLLKGLEGDPDAVPRWPLVPDGRTLIVVLGSGQMWAPDGRRLVSLDLEGWERVHAGVDLWRRTGGTLLFAGGPDGDDANSLAAAMAGVAQELGVPASAIELQPRSSTTHEDLALAQPTIRQYKGPVWLVTSAIHMPRAQAVAARLGLAMRPYPVGYLQIRHPTWRAWLPHNGVPERFAMILHELVGRLVYALDARLPGSEGSPGDDRPPARPDSVAAVSWRAQPGDADQGRSASRGSRIM